MGKLFLVPTPVGNMGDMTFRAVEVLKNVDFILAEDTRTSSKLMSRYSIDTRLRAYHQFNEHQVCAKIVNEINNAQGDVALITDAGTPGISDPGFLLIRECINADIEIECLPGATAFVPALVQSGLASDKFVFEGFLPHKKGRNARLENLALQENTIVLYESPHRLLKTLAQLIEILGKDRKACVCREISKIYAESRRGPLEELLSYYEQKPAKGEIVIVVEGYDKETYTYKYARPALTVDMILTAILPDNTKYILLIERKNEPFAEHFALPGGFVDMEETLEWAVLRELREETGVWLKDYDSELKFFRPYSTIDRDPRGRTISMVYSAEINVEELPEIEGLDDATDAQWVEVNKLENLKSNENKLAFDHDIILRDFFGNALA